MLSLFHLREMQIYMYAYGVQGTTLGALLQETPSTLYFETWSPLGLEFAW